MKAYLRSAYLAERIAAVVLTVALAPFACRSPSSGAGSVDGGGGASGAPDGGGGRVGTRPGSDGGGGGGGSPVSTGDGGAKDAGATGMGGAAGATGTAGASGAAGAGGGPVGVGGARAGAGGTAGRPVTGSGGSGGMTTVVPVAFPVAHSTNGRYLQDQNGVPFPILGRAAWYVLSRPVADYQAFLNDTLTRGHDLIEVTVMGHDPRANNPPHNGNGDLPFLKRLDGGAWSGSLTYGNAATEAPDFTTPNESYWAFVDAFLAYCQSKAILVLLFPAYVGFQGGSQGWMQEVSANGTARMAAYGAWIATRYKSQKNIVWMAGGDYGTGSNPFTSAQSAVESALLTGMRGITGQQSVEFGAEWNSESIGIDQPTFGSIMTLNGVYSFLGVNVAALGLRAYGYTPVLPAYLMEEPYDEEGPDGNSVNPSATQPVRRFQWWGWLTTIGGYNSGNGYVWPFNDPDWKNHLDTQGSRDMTRLNAFIRSINWWQLVPSGQSGLKSLVTAGGGSPTDAGYVAAAAIPSGTLLVAYVPPAHTGSITIDMSAMSATVRARWFNPTTAVYTTIGSFPNTGTHAFTTPGNNGSGSNDWALVLDTQ